MGPPWIHCSEVTSCRCPAPLPVSLRSNFPLLERCLLTQLWNAIWDLGGLCAHSEQLNLYQQLRWTSQTTVFHQARFYKGYPGTQISNYNIDNNHSSVEICPRSQNPQVGHPKGNLEVPEDVLLNISAWIILRLVCNFWIAERIYSLSMQGWFLFSHVNSKTLTVVLPNQQSQCP